jgi:U4/U6.U5 tri-snRNP component SNU23
VLGAPFSSLSLTPPRLSPLPLPFLSPLPSPLLQLVTDTTPVSQVGGYYCAVCECTLRDNVTYLDHINGKNHQRKLGYSMRAERSTLSQVQERLQAAKAREEAGKRAASASAADGGARSKAAAYDEYEARLAAQEREEEEERRRKRMKRAAAAVGEGGAGAGAGSGEQRGGQAPAAAAASASAEGEPAGEEEEDEMAAMLGFGGFGGGKKG